MYWNPARPPREAVSIDILMLMRYWASATDSQLPLIVIVRSRFAGASLSSQLDIRIIAPLICLISAIFEPPLPITHPMISLGTVISWVWCVLAPLPPLPASAARAAGLRTPGPNPANPLMWLKPPGGSNPPFPNSGI